MSDDDFVNVEWNEFVTYTARIPRDAMDEALAAKNSANSAKVIVGKKIEWGTEEAIAFGGMENITFHDDDGNQIGEL